jgi:hypothetical protein
VQNEAEISRAPSVDFGTSRVPSPGALPPAIAPTEGAPATAPGAPPH